MDDPHPQPHAEALDAYVDALLQCTGQLMLIIDHMAAFDAGLPPEQAPDESAPETLRRMITEVTAPEIGKRERAHLSEATALLELTADVVGREIFLVPMPGDGPSAGRRPSRRRRRPS